MIRLKIDLHRPLARRALRMALAGLSSSMLAWSAMAQSTTVYRCGPDGRSYSQHACAEGRAVDVADRRTTAQRAEGDAATLRTQRAIDETLWRPRPTWPLPRLAGALTAAPSTEADRADAARSREMPAATRAPRGKMRRTSGQAFEAVTPAQRSKPRKT